MTVLIVFILTFIIGYLIFGRERNPYIKTHKQKFKNEKHYKDYIKWLDSCGGDIPLNEFKMNHEDRVLKELNKSINK